MDIADYVALDTYVRHITRQYERRTTPIICAHSASVAPFWEAVSVMYAGDNTDGMYYVGIFAYCPVAQAGGCGMIESVKEPDQFEDWDGLPPKVYESYKDALEAFAKDLASYSEGM